MKIRLMTVALALAATTMLSSPLLAQEPDPGHPRINSVDNGISHQENNTLRQEQRGNLTPGQANRDMRQDQRIQGQEERDAKEHGGHITKGEERHLKMEERKEHREKMRQERRDRREHREHHEHHEHGEGGVHPDMRR